jgi:hypothetical protein
MHLRCEAAPSPDYESIMDRPTVHVHAPDLQNLQHKNKFGILKILAFVTIAL